MHIATAIGAFLLGGWVLDSAVEDQPQLAEPLQLRSPAAAPLMPYRPDTMNQNHAVTPTSPEAAAQMQNRTTMGRQMPNRQRQGGLAAPSMMPSAPTASGLLGQPMTPHTPTSSMYPSSPTAALGYRPSLNTTQPSHSPKIGSASALAPSAEKAFTGYRPTSGVSPYMNLFRGNSRGVDNYSTMVRPELEQRAMNQQFGTNIQGLERNTRMQGAALQQLNRDTRNLQGVGTPQFYMNYGNYYPAQNQGFGQ